MGRVALVLALLGAGVGLSACGGGGGNPGECRGSLEVCSEGREPGTVVTTTTSGVGASLPDSDPSAAPAGDAPPTIPVNAGSN